MNKTLEKIRSIFSSLKKPNTEKAGAQNEGTTRPRVDRFVLFSWVVTWVIVIAALGFAFWKTQSNAAAEQALVPQPTAAPDANQPNVTLPLPASAGGGTNAIDRALELKTNIPDRPRYDPITYRVTNGDAMFNIAKSFNIKPETILYSNKDELDDNPHNLRPGMELIIPPVDGLYYKWQEGDTVQKVAAEFKANPDDILNFPGNNLDLTDPQIKPGTLVMIPGGSRELIDWTKFIPTYSRGSSGAGTGTSNIGTHAWSTGYRWHFEAGSQLSAVNSVPVAATAPGATVEISVPMTAIGRLCPGRAPIAPSRRNLPIRGPSTIAPASPVMPPVMCTTEDPAKSTWPWPSAKFTPICASHPPPHTQLP